ncbi:A/G-specific adenine glycosylase [Candidatus Uhrbacteria bacterium]|nr:A/G-specific adenine glycosylase [Candidatus Uhrbacteria bacterium]
MSIRQFQSIILNWYTKNGRHALPWRKTRNSYRILVSEIMLQQTQVDRVIRKYKEFLRAFPTPKALATASVQDLLKVWKGLGYNRRALNLQRAAQKIVHDFKGVFPKSIADIESLPGVGPYTARAVSAFAFNAPVAFIETNIRRIFIHFFFGNKKTVSDVDILPMVQKALWEKDPHQWYSALMDYGALAMKDINNPNRKSRHYTRQSRFEGSRRYARAKMLDYIMTRKSANLVLLHEYSLNDSFLEKYRSKESIRGILSDLAREGFIEIEDRKKTNTTNYKLKATSS